MTHLTWLRSGVLAGLLAVPGCSSNSTPQDLATPTNLGVTSSVDLPTDVAAVHTFYVVPNTQVAMSNSFIAGAPLQQVFAARIAEKLTARGLTQAPADSADARVVFVVQNPAAAPAAAAAGPTQGLSYADQLLAEAKSLQTKDNFLKNDQMNLRIDVIRSTTNQTIWHGSIAGVTSPGQDNRGRLLDMLAAVDKLLSTYPEQKH